MSLCRHYVRELRRSVLIDTPELEKAASKRSSAVLDNYDMMGGAGPSNEKSNIRDESVSQALRSEQSNRPVVHSHTNSHSSDRSGNSSSRRKRRSTGPSAHSPGHSPGHAGDSSSSPGNLSSTPQHTVTRQDIRASAEKILYTYLLPGSEREIIIPQGILENIQDAIEERSRDDPEVFDAAKDYVFQAMERDAFPGFLRAKALGNLVPPSMMIRLIVGLLSLFGGLWAGFILIFLDYSRTRRCWVSTCSCNLHHLLTVYSSSFPSPSAYTFSLRTSTCSTLSLLSSASLSTLSSPSVAFANRSCASFSLSAPGWSYSPSSLSMQRFALCLSSSRANACSPLSEVCDRYTAECETNFPALSGDRHT